MDGGNVQKKKFDRNIQLEYSQDRLIDMKMIQAYQLLVPDKVWVKDINKQRGNREHASSGTICESIIGPTKGRAHY
jgi:hypothetical protein